MVDAGTWITPLHYTYHTHPINQTVALFGPQLASSTPFTVPLDEEIAPSVMVLKRRGYYHE